MKYEPIEFSKLSEAVAYVEDGGELFVKRNSNHGYSESNICSVSINNLCIYDFWKDSTLCTKLKPAPWDEKLDGTVENGVLCRCDAPGVVFLCIRVNAGNYYDEQDNRMGKNITPLTRTEIQKFMDNAPEEA